MNLFATVLTHSAPTANYRGESELQPNRHPEAHRWSARVSDRVAGSNAQRPAGNPRWAKV